ncbi:MAG: gliding motility-associated C-terminal domain-containing protein [Bacteroidales bacterium]|nr:gliding motility-associated C-terminal domain-containing protein [Bacteroidales bacterium]
MRHLLLVLMLLFLAEVNASHQKADEITYVHLGGYTYRATLISYTFTGTETDRPYLEINWGDGKIDTVERKTQTILADAEQTFLNIYEAEHTYSGTGSYYISMTDPTRNGGVINIPNSIDIPMYVQTLLVISPFFSGGNNSAVLTNRPIDRACVGRMFIHNPGAYDPDGDSLSYKLISCKTEEGMDIPGYTFPASSNSFSIDEITGDVLWDVPVSQGEYNIAIVVEEWRYGRKTGEITRDMQVRVQQCDNTPPILKVQNYCVAAGDTFAVPVQAHDPDGDAIRITATGELFMLPEDEQPTLLPLNDTAILFSWRVPYSTPRKAPYTVYCKATDSGIPNLSDLKEFTINVVAPSPVIAPLQITDSGNPQLHFGTIPVPHVSGYNIYRYSGMSDPVQDSCNGGLHGENFILIAVTQDTFYTDTSRLQNGMTYCYRVTALLKDGSESLFSNEECFTVKRKGVPIFTHTSIEKTHPYQGTVKVRWIMLPDDTGSGYKGQQFALYRVETGEAGDTAKLIRLFPFDTAVTFYDSLRNTEKDIQRYNVVLSDTALTQDTVANDMQQTAVNSTLYLQAFSYSRKVVLRWQDNQLWHNRYYRVYRASASENIFMQIARTSDILYADTAVINDSTYIYYIEGEGTYFNTQIESPMLNKSNETQAMPQVQPPCTPKLLSVEGDCGGAYSEFKNVLEWTVDCDLENIEDIVQYNIYSAPAGDTNYVFTLSADVGILPIAETITDTSILYPLRNICYTVTAVNIKEQESGYSNAICIDNRACFILKLPNVFTPNQDKINDVFRPDPEKPQPQLEYFMIQIFDRWGKLVFKADKFSFMWNGCYMNGNNACPDGAYFYVVEFSAPSEGIPLKQTQSGSVVILR